MPEKKKLPPLKVENAKLVYKNFAGAAREYNAAGFRNFHVVLDNDLAKTLAKDGWNVKWHEPKKEGDELWASLKVTVRFDNFPPNVFLCSPDGSKQTKLDGESVSILDDAELESIDMVITSSFYSRPTGSGFKAYLKTMYATLSSSDLAAKHMLKKESNQRPEDD